MTFAADTSVPVVRSQGEIQTMLRAAGVERLAVGEDVPRGVAYVFFAFRSGASARYAKIELPLPKLATLPRPRGRTKRSPQQRLEQAHRSRWRAMHLLIKAKLEAIELGITTMEHEFLADVMLPSGESVHARLAPLLTEAYQSGKEPQVPMLLGGAP